MEYFYIAALVILLEVKDLSTYSTNDLWRINAPSPTHGFSRWQILTLYSLCGVLSCSFMLGGNHHAVQSPLFVPAMTLKTTAPLRYDKQLMLRIITSSI